MTKFPHDTDGTVLQSLLTAPHAMVMLWVAWSGPSRIAGGKFRNACEWLSAEHPELDLEFCTLDEDEEWCQAWLTKIEFPGHCHGIPLGAGSLAWLEKGRLVASERSSVDLTATDIVTRSLEIWKKQTYSVAGSAPIS